MIFEDRIDAGKKLAERLMPYKGPDVLVVAIPRGGVVVGFEISSQLMCLLDLVIPRKIGAPGEPELAIGAVTLNSVILDEEMVAYLGVSQEYVDPEVQIERAEIARRIKVYRGDRPPAEIAGQTIILVDDGIATGYTMMAAAEEIRAKNPANLIIAAPIASVEAIDMLRPKADELVVLDTPVPFFSVGSWYNTFDQTTDDEVIRLLDRVYRTMNPEMGKA